MCIIAIKPRNINMPDKEVLAECFFNNPDGAGFAFVRGGLVHIRKGYMKFETFNRALAGENIQKEELLLCHFRIATAGSVSRGNTHPFPVSIHKELLKATHLTTDLILAHNGVLSCGGDKNDDLSDTQNFCKILATPAIRGNIKNKGLLRLIAQASVGSKLVMITKEGELLYTGTGWIKDEPTNIFYSNSSYKKKESYNVDKYEKYKYYWLSMLCPVCSRNLPYERSVMYCPLTVWCATCRKNIDIPQDKKTKYWWKDEEQKTWEGMET